MVAAELTNRRKPRVPSRARTVSIAAGALHRYGAAELPSRRSVRQMPDDLRHPAIDKSRLPSRHVTVGPERAPHRAFLYSMGLSEEQINQPLGGVATTWNEAAPCNIALARQAQAAKKGVAAAHGTPREFTTITVTDGIAIDRKSTRLNSSHEWISRM